MPKISVIVPIYNVGAYVEQCIKSILKQTVRDIEVILINDGSIDFSGEICRRYAQSDARVLYIETENRGVAAARNAGMDKASGEWICFVDGDDYLPENALELLLNGNTDADVIVGNYFADKNGAIYPEKFFSDNISDNNRKNLLFLLGNALGCPFYGAVYHTNIGVPWAKLYRNQFCRNSNMQYPNLKRMQDTVFNIMVFKHTNNISFVDDVVYYYRIIGDSAVHRYTPDFENTVDMILDWIKVLIRDDTDTRISELYDFKLLMLVLETIKLEYLHPECPLKTLEKIEKIKRLCEEKSVGKVFFNCNKRLFAKKQRLLLELLSHKQYIIVFCLLFWKMKLTYIKTFVIILIFLRWIFCP